MKVKFFFIITLINLFSLATQAQDDIVKAGGRGVANGHGFYKYTDEEAWAWEQTFKNFSYEIRELALKYPADVVSRQFNGDKK